MNETEIRVRYYKQQIEEIQLFRQLCYSNSIIHAGLRTAIQNDSDLEKFFKFLVEHELLFKQHMEKEVEDEISRHKLMSSE